MIPAYAREQMAAFLAPVRRREVARSRENDDAPVVAAEAPAPSSKAIRRQTVRPSGLRDIAALALLLATLGCTAEAREPIPTVDLEPLAARVEALDARREFVRDASEACRAACLPTVPHRIAIYADHAACECWRPNVGVKEVR